MTNRIWPVDAVAGAPAYSGRALRQTQAPFVAGATAARPLGGYSGVRPGTPASTLVVSPTAWTVRPHGGVLDVQTAAEAGPYTYAIDTAVSGTVTAADSSNPRVDIVYVRVTDSAEDGAAPGVAGNVTVGYLAGNPAPVPTAPAPPARSIVLGRVNVPKAGSGNPTASWVAPYSTSTGGTLYVNTATELTPALALVFPPKARAVALDAELAYEVRTVNGVRTWVIAGAEERFAHFLIRADGVPDGGPIQTGSIYAPPSNNESVNAEFAAFTGSDGRVSLTGTEFTVVYNLVMPRRTTSRGFLQVVNVATGEVLGRGAFTGEDYGTMTTTFRMPSGSGVIRFSFVKFTGDLSNVTGSIRIRRHA